MFFSLICSKTYVVSRTVLVRGIFFSEPRHRAHRSEAAVWKCSFETVAVDLEAGHGSHRLKAGRWKCSFEA
eukprot:2546899-Amphidinium_carterae.1